MSDGIMPEMASTAKQFANQYADSQGGWGNVAKQAATSAIKSTGSFVANELLGVDDFKNVGSAVSKGDWWGAAKSLGEGVFELGTTVGAVAAAIPTGGASIAADAARIAAKQGGKEAVEVGAKELLEQGTKNAAETGVKEATQQGEKEAAQQGEKKAVEEESNLKKAEKDIKRLRRLDNFHVGFDSPSIPGQNVHITKVY